MALTIDLMGWQRKWLRAVLAPDCRIGVLSGPRGLGKSTLTALIARRFLTPGDKLHVHGGEAHLVAASLAQCRRTTFKQLKRMIGDDPEYVIGETVNHAFCRHRPSGAVVDVLAANSKTAQGLVDPAFVLADEPGAWEIVGGLAVSDALETALDKPGSEMRIIYIGTLAPKATGPGHWYFDLVAGGSDPASGVHVLHLKGNADKWASTATIRACNPLMWKHEKSRRRLLMERDKAVNDSRLRARFQSYRLNVPSRDESELLLATDDIKRSCARPPALPGGRPIVGIDLGGGRAWSAAVALWGKRPLRSLGSRAGNPGPGSAREARPGSGTNLSAARRAWPATHCGQVARPATGAACRGDPRPLGRPGGRDLRPLPLV